MAKGPKVSHPKYIELGIEEEQPAAGQGQGQGQAEPPEGGQADPGAETQ
jgi:hypothetical protein